MPPRFDRICRLVSTHYPDGCVKWLTIFCAKVTPLPFMAGGCPPIPAQVRPREHDDNLRLEQFCRALGAGRPVSASDGAQAAQWPVPL
jgi:hypothetical protein